MALLMSVESKSCFREKSNQKVIVPIRILEAAKPILYSPPSFYWDNKGKVKALQTSMKVQKTLSPSISHHNKD